MYRVRSAVFILAFSFSLLASASAHDIHISYSQAEMKGNELFVKVSYYKDDLTKAVKSWYQGRADNFSAQEMQNAEFDYVKNYFRVWAGDYNTQVQPVLEKLNDDGTSIIFEMKFTCTAAQSIIIDQRVLFKEYSDQMNIFFIKGFGKDTNHIFTPSKPTLLVKS